MNYNTYHKESGYPLQEEAIIMNKGKRIRSKSSSKKKQEALKVVYISTPMKVTTSASKFREIVQELTGRESDVVRIMETSGGNDTWTVSDDNEHLQQHHHHHHQSHIHNIAHAREIISTTATTTTTSDDDDGRGVLPFVLGHDGSSPSSSEELADHHGGGSGGADVFLRGGQDSNFGIFDQSTNLFYDHLFQHLDLLNSY